MSWSVLRCSDDWLTYKIERASEVGITIDQTTWNEPKMYPCLADSICVQGRILTAFVDVAAAQQLLNVAVPPESPQPSTSPHGLNNEGSRIVSPDQSACNAALTAHIFTIIHYLTETGICRKDQYEARLAVSQRIVQEAHADAARSFQEMLNGSCNDYNKSES